MVWASINKINHICFIGWNFRFCVQNLRLDLLQSKFPANYDKPKYVVSYQYLVKYHVHVHIHRS